jgi:hypothetical protein
MTRMTYNEMGWLAKRHDLSESVSPTVRKMMQSLEELLLGVAKG